MNIERKNEENAALKFGIPKDLFDNIETASGLQSIYDFGDEESEKAFSLSTVFKISLEEAFNIIWLLNQVHKE